MNKPSTMKEPIPQTDEILRLRASLRGIANLPDFKQPKDIGNLMNLRAAKAMAIAALNDGAKPA